MLFHLSSEVWLLNNTLLSKLVSFQADLGKRMLRLPKSTANSIPLLAMGLPSVRARILISKLKFLYKIVHGEDNLASQAFRSISVNNIESMSIIRQCRFLESAYSSNLMSTVLNTDDLLLASIKKTVLELDRSRILSDAEGHASQSYMVEVVKAGAWPKFWDNALNCGPEGTKSALIAILQTLCKTCYSDQLCSAQNCSFEIPKGSAPCDHFIQCHTDLNCSANKIVSNIVTQDFDVLSGIGRSLHKFIFSAY